MVNSETTLESLPVELVAGILSQLPLESLIVVSNLSRRLREVCSDPALNPWRKPILSTLRHDAEYSHCLRSLSVRSTVPRHNWIDVLSLARPDFILFQASLPSLPDAYWGECFSRRFLPSWKKIKKSSRWREAFLKILTRVWHRTHTSCTTEEAWTKYVVLNRSGSANELEVSSRNFNPLALLDEMKLQGNLAHLESHVRLLVDLEDVRILALGVLHRPRGTFLINNNARLLLHPTGIERCALQPDSETHHLTTDCPCVAKVPQTAYQVMNHPSPTYQHTNYPFFTASGLDQRWLEVGAFEEEGRFWVGGLLITAQLIRHNERVLEEVLFDLPLVTGPGRNQYASFTLTDLFTIAPWMEQHINKRIVGQGLGND